jgi:hypothetical protein
VLAVMVAPHTAVMAAKMLASTVVDTVEDILALREVDMAARGASISRA